MTVKDTLSGLVGLLFMGIVLVLGVVVAAVFISGTEWAFAKLMPLFSTLTLIAFGIAVFILLPLAIPKATRGFSSVALFIASFVFGATLFLESFLLTLAIWGVLGLLVGLFLGGVGVVPIAMLATLFNGLWIPLGELVLLTIMTLASRAGAMSLAESLEG